MAPQSRQTLLTVLALMALMGPMVLPPLASTARAQAMPASRDSPAIGLERLLQEARATLEAGETRAAYERLKREEHRFIGIVAFDYLLGLAALDTGYPAEAILHLERVLINQPDFLQARAEIARAYLKAQEPENARREFQTVAAQEIPVQARRIISGYLDLIQREQTRRQEADKTVWRGHIESDIGHDSNANYGTSSASWVLADGTRVLPLATSTPNPSPFWGVSGAVEVLVPISGRVSWTSGLRFSARSYPGASALSQSQVELSTGLKLQIERAQYTVLAQTQDLHLDGKAFRRATGLAAQAQFEPDAAQAGAIQWGFFAQAFDMGFPGLDSRDARRLTAGLSGARVIAARSNFIALASLYGGRESARTENLSYDFAGVRVLLSRSLNAQWTGQVSASFEQRHFDGSDALFGVRREDRQTEFRLGAERALGKQWVLMQDVTWTRNRSSLQPNDYQRSQWRVSIRYKF